MIRLLKWTELDYVARRRFIVTLPPHLRLSGQFWKHLLLYSFPVLFPVWRSQCLQLVYKTVSSITCAISQSISLLAITTDLYVRR